MEQYTIYLPLVSTLTDDTVVADKYAAHLGELFSVINPASNRLDAIPVSSVGPLFEHAAYFPDRINTEFIRVVNPSTIKMRVWERGSGETMACGTGAIAAVMAAIANGFCAKDTDVTVRAKGGDLIVHYTDEHVTLTGDARLVFTGVVEY